MGKYKILVVDDEESLCEILKFNLELEGYEVDVAYSAEQALAMHPERYSLLLLDVMMGEISGFKMARMLKSSPETAAVPIIFCTAKDTEDDTVAGLNLGADDYISKPFSMREVTARVRSVLRRSQARQEEEAICFEGLCLDLQSKVCRVNGQEVPLTKKEFEILTLLLSHPRVIFSREQILARVWNNEVIVLDRTIDVNITRLRKKIGPYGYGFEKSTLLSDAIVPLAAGLLVAAHRLLRRLPIPPGEGAAHGAARFAVADHQRPTGRGFEQCTHSPRLFRCALRLLRGAAHHPDRPGRYGRL